MKILRCPNCGNDEATVVMIGSATIKIINDEYVFSDDSTRLDRSEYYQCTKCDYIDGFDNDWEKIIDEKDVNYVGESAHWSEEVGTPEEEEAWMNED